MNQPESNHHDENNQMKTTLAEAGRLARQLLNNNSKKQEALSQRLVDICAQAQDKDFLLIHNPGGWGHTPLEHSLQWERSIIEGARDKIAGLGYRWWLTQYTRSGYSWLDKARDAREQFTFFARKAKVMAAELNFIIQHLSHIRVIMIGVSQGAAFGNAVMEELGPADRVYSIELGMPFPYKSRRIITENTLTIDGNGLMPDALMEWDISTIGRTYLVAPFRWIKSRLRGKPKKFTHCINIPGHDYNWEYTEVQGQIGGFLAEKFGIKSDVEVVKS